MEQITRLRTFPALAFFLVHVFEPISGDAAAEDAKAWEMNPAVTVTPHQRVPQPPTTQQHSVNNYR